MFNNSNKKTFVFLIIGLAVLIGAFFSWQYWQRAKNVEVENIETLGKLTDEKLELNLNTTKLATLPEGESINHITFSPDGRRVAYVIEEHISPDEPDRDFVVVDGQKSEAYNRAYDLVFSPNGKHFAYAVKKREKVLHPDKGTYEHIGGEFFTVLDGKKGKSYDEVQHPTFSPDSQRFAYAAEKNGSHFVVLDGKKGKPTHCYITDLFFSPNSKRLAYEIGCPHWYDDGEDSYMVIDGKKQKYHSACWDFTFSPDSKHFAYVSDGKIIFDGREWKNFDISSDACPFLTFSSDSQHLACGINTGGGHFIVIDDKKAKQYGNIPGIVPNTTPVFSPDLKHFAYSASRPKDDKYLIVLDDNKESKAYGYDVSSPVFSLNGKHFAYIAMNNPRGKHTVVVDEKEISTYEAVYYGPVFTSDSKYVYYGARIGNELWWIVNKVENISHSPEASTR